jgi:hypothetical protein
MVVLEGSVVAAAAAAAAAADGASVMGPGALWWILAIPRGANPRTAMRGAVDDSSKRTLSCFMVDTSTAVSKWSSKEDATATVCIYILAINVPARLFFLALVSHLIMRSNDASSISDLGLGACWLGFLREKPKSE